MGWAGRAEGGREIGSLRAPEGCSLWEGCRRGVYSREGQRNKSEEFFSINSLLTSERKKE